MTRADSVSIVLVALQHRALQSTTESAQALDHVPPSSSFLPLLARAFCLALETMANVLIASLLGQDPSVEDSSIQRMCL
jgi:hypothetical protein